MQDTLVSDISKELERKSLKYCVIIDSNSYPVGIISVQDIVFRAVAKNLNCQNLTAKDIMTKEIEVIPIESTKEDLVEYLRSLKTHSLPVTKNKQVIGMIDIWSLWNYLHKYDSIDERILSRDRTKKKMKSKLHLTLSNFETY